MGRLEDAGHDRHHGAGIEAAAQESSDGDIAHQVRLHGVLEPRPEGLGRDLFRERRASVAKEWGRLPVTTRIARPAVLDQQGMTRRELGHPLQNAQGIGHVAVLEIRDEGLRIQPSRQPGALEQGFQL